MYKQYSYNKGADSNEFFGENKILKQKMKNYVVNIVKGGIIMKR